MSLAICKLHPGVFSKCAALSPSLWWNDRQIIRQLESDGGWMRNARIWLYMGTREGRVRDDATASAIEDARTLVAAFDAHGLVPGHHYYYWEEFGGEHNEAAWARRVDKMLLFFFAPEKKSD